MTAEGKKTITDEMKNLRRLSWKPEERDSVIKILERKTDSQLLDLFERIIENNPFSYKTVIELIVAKLYSDVDRFVNLLCNLIEKASPDMACGNIIGPIEEIALKQPEVTISISEKMKTRGVRPGICSGFVISPLLGKGVIDEEVIRTLESDDHLTKRQYLVALCNSFIRRDEEAAKLYIPKLLEIAERVDEEDSDILIQTLITASRINEKPILPVLEKELEKRGFIAAITFIYNSIHRPDAHIDLLKKAVKMMEIENPRHELVDEALNMIYKEDPDFIVERLRSRLNEDIVSIARMHLEHTIQSNPAPVIKMLEEEIDNENPTMMQIGASILDDFLPSIKDWLEWCKKWKDDEKKETVVLKLLAKVLSESRNKQPDEISDEAIGLMKEFAKRKGIDYDSETKGIKLEDEEKHKEEIFKALHVANQILYPPIEIDTEALERVLKKYPYVCKAFGTGRLIRSATSKKPHLLAYIFSQELDEAWMKELEEKYEAETDEVKKAWIAHIYHLQLQKIQEQVYWEQVFGTLDEHRLQIPPRKLRNSDNDASILAEAEVIARLAPHFNIKLEPDIEQLRPKKLDARIEYNGQEALIEVAAVERKLEHQKVFTHSVVSSMPGDKIKNVLLYKFEGQLKEGKVDPGLPIVLVLNIGAFAGPFMDVENAIYGQFQFSYKMNTETHTKVEEGSSRAYENAFYKVENTDIVTAIAGYERDYTKKDPLIGRLYLPFASQTPKNSITKEFRLRLRDALFGDSENSAWKTLMKVEGIDEEMAKKFHSNGIEDLGVLASTEGEELSVEGFTGEQLIEFQKEAIRVIGASQTGSVRYLKGMDQKIFDTLQKEGLYLIEELLKATKPPDGVSSAKWEEMIKDAKRIKQKGEEE